MRTYAAVALVLLTLALWPGASTPPGRSVASKKFTESVILGELLRLVGEHAGYPLAHLREVGGTQIVFRSLEQGEALAYVEYTGTIDEEILGSSVALDASARRAQLEGRGVSISPPLGFQNTYALAMRRDRARELNLTRISQLSQFPDLRFGLSNEFLERADGWPALRKAYQLSERNVFGLDHDLAYRQLASGEIDVVDAYTTDAQIDVQDLVILDDDRHYFPRYDAVVLFRSQLRSSEASLVQAWERLVGILDESTMRQLNRRVELEQIDEATVAADFLRAKLDIETSVETLSRTQRIGKHLREHLQLVRRSLLPAILLAVPLGVLAWRLPVLGQVLLAIAGVIQTIPALALLVLLMPVASWLGFASVGEDSMTAVAALFLYSLLPIARNTVVGLKNVPESLRDSADALGLNRFWRLHYVELPLATRTILAGIKTATVLNIGYATLGALIGAGGLGQPIMTGIRLNRFELILDGAIPAALLALVAQALFEMLEWVVVSRGLR